MAKNIIVAGKDYNKSSKAENIAKQLELNAVFTNTSVWNRNSPISAKSIIINAENKFEKIDAGLIFFEATDYNQVFKGIELQNYDQACDELILGYQFMTAEFLKRFEKKQHGKLFFVLRPMQSLADFFKLSSREQQANPNYANLIVSTAQQAFRTFAENIAATSYKENGPAIYLVEIGQNTTEQQVFEWLKTKIEEESPVYKNSKQAVTWLSPDERTKLFGK